MNSNARHLAPAALTCFIGMFILYFAKGKLRPGHLKIIFFFFLIMESILAGVGDIRNIRAKKWWILTNHTAHRESDSSQSKALGVLAWLSLFIYPNSGAIIAFFPEITRFDVAILSLPSFFVFSYVVEILIASFSVNNYIRFHVRSYGQNVQPAFLSIASENEHPAILRLYSNLDKGVWRGSLGLAIGLILLIRLYVSDGSIWIFLTDTTTIIPQTVAVLFSIALCGIHAQTLMTFLAFESLRSVHGEKPYLDAAFFASSVRKQTYLASAFACLYLVFNIWIFREICF